MEAKSNNEIIPTSDNCDRQTELEDLHQRKFTVKELVDDCGLDKIPSIFRLPQEHQPNGSSNVLASRPHVPVIDLKAGAIDDGRKSVVEEIRDASERWGMFQMINHGIPKDVIEGVLDGVRRFHEQKKESKVEFYTKDSSKKVMYSLSTHLALKTALWKDTLICDFDTGSDDLEVHLVCRRQPKVDVISVFFFFFFFRKEITEYVRYINGLKETLSELLSEAMGLRSSHLRDTQCLEAQKFIAHYAPACPQPELTLATAKHADPYFFTILLQNNIDGVQVLHDDHWVDVMPVKGALVGIIGDMLQLVSNDMFKSPEHRGLARPIGPRLSIGCFFHPCDENKDRLYGPIKQLISENNPPLYKKTSLVEYQKCFWLNGTAGSKALPHIKL